MSGLDALAATAGSQYALQHMQHSTPQHHVKKQEPNMVEDDDDVDEPGRESSVTQKVRSESGSVRRRISRACDQCNQLRTKCDGKQPCAHCIGMFEG